jgi:hypothetical protein
LTSWVTISFSNNILLHEVSNIIPCIYVCVSTHTGFQNVEYYIPHHCHHPPSPSAIWRPKC